MLKHFDIIIIGAGPGGLQCAATLAANGREVLVLERGQTIGRKVCAGGIPHHALQDLHFPVCLIEKSFQNQHIYTPCQQVVLKTKHPAISTVNREKLGSWMLQKAQQAGAEIRTGCTVTQITPTQIKTSEGEISYRHLIGADGSSSLVRRYLKIPSPRQGAGLQYQLPKQLANMEWHLDPHRFNSGYVWVFPHKDSASIGIYADRDNLRPGLLKERLWAWATRRGIDLSLCKPEAALINFDYRGWNFGNVFLVGDAAGLASAFTGEGIYPAIISGDVVAHTILDKKFISQRLSRIIQQHIRHRHMQRFFTGNKVICQISLEMLVLALRAKFLGFSLMEMH